MPLSRSRSTWSCFCGAILAVRGSNLKLPDMPRCKISVPAPQSSKRYFPRRVTVLIFRPQSVRSRSGTGQRRFGFRTVKPAILRPSSPEAMPRRTTSTSGSSGNSNVGMECWDKEVAGYGQGRGNAVQDCGFTGADRLLRILSEKQGEAFFIFFYAATISSSRSQGKSAASR